MALQRGNYDSSPPEDDSGEVCAGVCVRVCVCVRAPSAPGPVPRIVGEREVEIMP